MSIAPQKRTWTTRDGKQKSAWIIRYQDGGKRRIQTFPTKGAASDWWAENRKQIEGGTYIPRAEAATVKEAGALWLQRAEADKLEPSSIRQYRQHLDIHIAPYFGETKLPDITITGVRDFETWLLENGRSPAMTRKAVSSLGAIMAEAMASGMVGHNPVRERPRNARRAKQDKRHQRRLEVGRDVPTPEQVKDAMVGLTGFDRAIFHTATRTGLRCSELRALRWSDIGFNSRVIHVRQRADFQNTIGSTKSSAGYRKVPLTRALADTLLQWRNDCPESEMGFVFPTSAGTPWLHGNLYRRVFCRIWIDAGIVKDDGRARYNIHSLRHFYASWCLNPKDNGGLGLMPQRVQQLMGHSSVNITMSRYGHWFSNPDGEADLFSEAEELAAA